MTSPTVLLNMTSASPTAPPCSNTALNVFLFSIDTVVDGLFICVGIAGNVISVLAFSSGKQTTTSILLIALAVADGLFLAVHCLLFMCLRSIYPLTCYFKEYNDLWPRIEVIEFPFGQVLQTSSIFFVLLVAVDRYLAVCWSPKSKLWCTVRNARIQIVIASVIAVALHIPRFWEQKAVNVDDSNNITKWTIIDTDLWERPSYRYHGYICTALVYVLPLVILTVINIRLMLTIKNSVRFRRRTTNPMNNEKEKSANKTTVMLCSVIGVFLICQIPYAADHLLYTTNSTFINTPSMNYFDATSNMLICFNSMANFFIYVIVGNTFRRKVKKLLTCSYRQSRCHWCYNRVGEKKKKYSISSMTIGSSVSNSSGGSSRETIDSIISNVSISLDGEPVRTFPYGSSPRCGKSSQMCSIISDGCVSTSTNGEPFSKLSTRAFDIERPSW